LSTVTPEQFRSSLRPQRPQRPRELQDPLNYYLYHRLSWRLALLLARTPVTPNMVSVFGMVFVLGAAAVYAQPWWPYSALFGMALHMTWHVVDGADGDLARMTGRASPKGEAIDGFCDHASHVVLYVVLAWLLDRQIGHAAWLVATVAGVSHAFQTNHVEVQRRQYQWWVYGVPWLRNTFRARETRSGPRGVLAALVALYLHVASGMTPHALKIDAAIARADGRDPVELARIRALIRGEAPPLLRLCLWLGPNPRAIVLGLAMLAGSPIWFFLYQAVWMNLLLAVSVVRHNQAARRIAARIGDRPA
jgi:phosphatidylglycerophosphate synthase